MASRGLGLVAESANLSLAATGGSGPVLMLVCIGEGSRNHCVYDVVHKDGTGGKRLREEGWTLSLELGVLGPGPGRIGGEMGSYFPLKSSSDSDLPLKNPENSLNPLGEIAAFSFA